MSSAPNPQGNSNSDPGAANMDYRADSSEIVAQKQLNMNENHMGAFTQVMGEEMGSNVAFGSQGMFTHCFSLLIATTCTDAMLAL